MLNTETQKTPSVYFQFEDYSKRKDFTSQLFDLSNTVDKNHDVQLRSHVKGNFIRFQEVPVEKGCQSKLKTQEFFQEFDNNFVVTFDSDIKDQQFSSSPDVDRVISLEQPEEQQQQTSLALHQQNNQTLQSFNGEFKSGISIEPRKIQSQKEKSSPIPSFQVKKRTVFKSKKRIQENSQQFKITKKKIICNKQNLDTFVRSKSCKIPQKERQKGFYLSLKVWKAFQNDGESKPDKKSKSTIFQYDNKIRQTMGSTLRSTTLEYWRQKFDRKNSQKNQKTTKRKNIFQRPFSHKQ